MQRPLRIAVVGGGPAGLLFAALTKLRGPQHEVSVFEQNAREVTFGFGVVFSHGALQFLERDAPEIYTRLAQRMQSWPVQKIVHRDEAMLVDGNGFSAIARIELLKLLQRFASDQGVHIEFDRHLQTLDPLSEFDLVVGADGIHSMVRRTHADKFRPRVEHLTNKFAWYGTARLFDCLTLTFRTNQYGAFVAHHYRYSPGMSTFIVECGAGTWYRAGLDRMSDDESRAYCEGLFAADLAGQPLISNRSIWRNFPLLSTQNWVADNTTLIGDALRTGHFSIGSGTRLALEDAIALARALDESSEVGDALNSFENTRKPIVDKIVAAANRSSFWYERIDDKMQMEPWELAYDYMMRSGRMSDERLREIAPRFMSAVEAKRSADPAWAARAEGRVNDPVPRKTPGALEISFDIPERYNAASILFDNIAASRGDKVALHCGPRSVTYVELCELAAQVGNALIAAGLTRGQRVLLLMLDTPEYAAAIFGAMRAGCVPVLINTLSPAELVAYYLQDSDAEVAIVHSELATLLEHEDVRATRLRHVVVVGANNLVADKHLYSVQGWKQWLEPHASALLPADTHRDEMALWMYSSGSTGRPKGVVHVHHDLPYTYQSYGRRVLGMREDDVVFSPPKIFFAYGFGNSLTFPFSVGASAVLHPGRPDPQAVFELIERHRPTILFGLPTLYNALLSHPGSLLRDLSSVRLCVSAAEVLSGEMFLEWKRRYGREIMEGLGSTEVLHMYLSNRIDLQKPGASGARVPGYEIKLTEADGNPVKRGESGIMWVRGDSSAPMYWHRPDKTRETMREGWIWTGDRFHEDEDGFYYFEGRADDLIKVSGQWVHPLEIERCLADHPAVQECVVLGVEDKNRLMSVQAWVVLRDGLSGGVEITTELQSFVKRELLPYKYPRVIQYVKVLPKTGTGKIDRQALKSMRTV
jgi:benzoate-CoA ligase family protein